MGFATGFAILALLCAPCAFKKDKWFGFTLWSTLAIGTIVVAAAFVASIALPVASTFADCRHYDPSTMAELSNLQVTCLRSPDAVALPDKMSGLKWMCKLGMFFGGSAASVATMLLLFMIKSCCCCNPSACAANGAGCGSGAAGEHPCIFRRAVHRFRSRFCRQQPLANSADDSSLPVSAPSYYEVSTPEGASEDAGLNPSSQYYGVN